MGHRSCRDRYIAYCKHYSACDKASKPVYRICYVRLYYIMIFPTCLCSRAHYSHGKSLGPTTSAFSISANSTLLCYYKLRIQHVYSYCSLFYSIVVLYIQCVVLKINCFELSRLDNSHARVIYISVYLLY